MQQQLTRESLEEESGTSHHIIVPESFVCHELSEIDYKIWYFVEEVLLQWSSIVVFGCIQSLRNHLRGVNTGSDNPNDYVPLVIFQFYIFEKSQVEHNHLDCQIFFGNRLHYWLLQLLLIETFFVVMSMD